MSQILKISHTAGFFSCCSVKLFKIAQYINTHRVLPDQIDYSGLFSKYNTENNSIHDIFFNEYVNTVIVDPYQNIDFSMSTQYKQYKNLKFDGLNPVMKKYFTPSEIVAKNIDNIYKKYSFQTQKICSVIYRGNDKYIETTISPYSVFLDKAKEVLSQHPDIRFHIQTDETEFKDTFLTEFPTNSFYCDELPTINKSKTTVTDETPPEYRINIGINFLSLIYIASQSHSIITHSGNVGVWCVLFRGNNNNIHQVFNNRWH
jgi:hypothetical protein